MGRAPSTLDAPKGKILFCKEIGGSCGVVSSSLTQAIVVVIKILKINNSRY